MTPEEYDAWYDSPRGRWIGETELGLLQRMLRPRPGETLLDVGCGSGWFTRRFATLGLAVTGLDNDPERIAFARACHPSGRYLVGDARALPFADAAFDRVIAVASLCFVADERQAMAEILRVARRRFAVGWLNRHSLLYRRKAGRGAYRGAAWHTGADLRALFASLPAHSPDLGSCVIFPGAGSTARLVERLLPDQARFGALLVTAGAPARMLLAGAA
ncbi:MAG TPA: class I SAM-dependent methyltransferase [Thiobacillaceae bacterium]|nr:class I SAM-dependent methyltransferase [Thiobacillaceae bacterium]